MLSESKNILIFQDQMHIDGAGVYKNDHEKSSVYHTDELCYYEQEAKQQRVWKEQDEQAARIQKARNVAVEHWNEIKSIREYEEIKDDNLMITLWRAILIILICI